MAATDQQSESGPRRKRQRGPGGVGKLARFVRQSARHGLGSLASTLQQSQSEVPFDWRRGLLVMWVWIVAAELSRFFAVAHLEFNLIWPPDGIAFGLVLAYGWRAIPPLMLAVAVWAIGIRGIDPVTGLAGVTALGISLGLVWWLMARVRATEQGGGGGRPLLAATAAYYGVLIGVGVSVLTVLGLWQFLLPDENRVLSVWQVGFVMWFSELFGALLFTRLTELTVLTAERRLNPERFRQVDPAGREGAFAEPVVPGPWWRLLWIGAWFLLIPLASWLDVSGYEHYATGVRYLNFILLTVAAFAFGTWFTHLAMVMTGMTQLYLATVELSRAGTSIFAVADQAILVMVIGAFAIFTTTGVMQRRLVERRLVDLSEQDYLTGLLNDRGLARQLQQLAAWPYPGHANTLIGLLVLGLDEIEDLVGFRGKNEIEEGVAKTLRKIEFRPVGPTDLAASRYPRRDAPDGDAADHQGLVLARSRIHEGFFGLLVRSSDSDQVHDLALRLFQDLNGHLFQFEEGTVRLRIAVGGVCMNSEMEPEDAFSTLMMACQVAADRTPERVYLAEAASLAIWQRRALLRQVESLREALHPPRPPPSTGQTAQQPGDAPSITARPMLPLGHFELHCQPIRNLHDPHERVAEVLLRWREESGVLVPPAQFLPLAERHGLMPQLDRWVIQRTLRQLCACGPSLAGLSKIAINLSGATLSDLELLDFIRAEIDRTGLRPGLLCFEVTETASIHKPEAARQVLGGLRELGCLLSLDDFGTGLASFAYLKSFKFDYLKIDGSFIRNLIDSPADQTMVAAIRDVAQTLGLRTIAEFVETEALIERLQALGIDYAQGYGVSRPMDLRSYLGLR